MELAWLSVSGFLKDMHIKVFVLASSRAPADSSAVGIYLESLVSLAGDGIPVGPVPTTAVLQPMCGFPVLEFVEVVVVAVFVVAAAAAELLSIAAIAALSTYFDCQSTTIPND